MYKYLLKGMKGNGGQKNGIFVPGCNGECGGGDVNWQDAGEDVDVVVGVEELADWDTVDVDVVVPPPVVPGAAEVPPTKPESKRKNK
jgi:hypothetical protein